MTDPERKITIHEWIAMSEGEMRQRVPDDVKDEDLPTVTFTWDEELNAFVVTGYTGVKH